jgi:hypothetical protein
MVELLEAIVLRSAEPQAAAWFRRSLGLKGPSGLMAPLRAAFAGAGRRLGDIEPSVGPDDIAQLRQAGLVAPERWRLPTFARAAFLLRALGALPADEQPNFVRELYRRETFESSRRFCNR